MHTKQIFAPRTVKKMVKPCGVEIREMLLLSGAGVVVAIMPTVVVVRWAEADVLFDISAKWTQIGRDYPRPI